MSATWNKTVRFLYTVIAVIAVGSAMAGCSPADRHKVLTFFFTGVPPLGSETAGKKPDKQQMATARLSPIELARLRSAKILKERQARLLRAVKWEHGPFAAKECERCHALAASLKIGGRGVARKVISNKTPKSVGGRLLAPPEELCLGCHDTKSTQAADERKLRLHGPVASGLCIGCHSPHASLRRFNLLEKGTVELCTRCHDKDGLRERTAAHRTDPDADCMNCHNPHMGRTAMILKAEFDERGRP